MNVSSNLKPYFVTFTTFFRSYFVYFSSFWVDHNILCFLQYPAYEINYMRFIQRHLQNSNEKIRIEYRKMNDVGDRMYKRKIINFLLSSDINLVSHNL